MIDFRSDTVTLPTEEMMRAMQLAEVGDDILREDISVQELECLAAQVVGQEASVFTVSGTMSNQIAVMALTERGEEIIVGDRSHIYNLEVGGVAALSQVQVKPVLFPDGRIPLAKLSENIRSFGVQSPRSSLLCIENTYDLNRGIAITRAEIENAAAFAHEHSMKIYMDGARIFNASQKLKVNVDLLCRSVDAVQFCLTKGLSAPFGAILAGPSSFIEKARWLKQRLGGGFRQAGYMAAAAIVALKSANQTIDDDNKKADYLAALLTDKCPEIINWLPDQTNIIKIDLSLYKYNEDWFMQYLKSENILIKPLGNNKYRLVCHKDIKWTDLEKASEIILKCIMKMR